MPRKRSYVRLPEKLAATLACLLPQAERDDLRNRRVPASEVISLFEFDHIVLHSFGGSNFWFNLDPKLVQPHREKSKKDTAIAAKAKRIDKKWTEFMSKVSARPKSEKKHKWAKRKLQSRSGFYR